VYGVAEGFTELESQLNGSQNDLSANTTRKELLKAMDGHVIGKAGWFGRYHAPPPSQ